MAWEENSRICFHMQLIAILSRTGVGIVDNSKLAADIGIAILFDIYGDDMKYEYPFIVAKFYSDWTIEGTLPEGVLGGVGHITLMRSDGMVSFYIHEK